MERIWKSGLKKGPKRSTKGVAKKSASIVLHNSTDRMQLAGTAVLVAEVRAYGFSYFSQKRLHELVG